jgi:hypothetical protein
MMDYEVQRCTRHCATSGRELAPGETVYSTLVAEGGRVVRHDYAQECWSGPPEGVLGWWKGQLPARDAKKLHWAPNDVMLQLLEELEGQLEKGDFRYVLSLLLVRRRVLRPEETETDDAGNEISLLFCPRNEKTYRVTTHQPDERRASEIQQELATLLIAGS